MDQLVTAVTALQIDAPAGQTAHALAQSPYVELGNKRQRREEDEPSKMPSNEVEAETVARRECADAKGFALRAEACNAGEEARLHSLQPSEECGSIERRHGHISGFGGPFYPAAPPGVWHGASLLGAGFSHSRAEEMKTWRPSRSTSSLSELTKDIAEILRAAPEGIVCMNEIAETLGVHKRRVYDVINVLEGIGLVRKDSKTTIQWTGDLPEQEEISALQASIGELRNEERSLDQEIAQRLQEVRELLLPCAYVSVEELRSLPALHGRSLLAVKAPCSATANEIPSGGHGYQLIVNGNGAQVSAWLLDGG